MPVKRAAAKPAAKRRKKRTTAKKATTTRKKTTVRRKTRAKKAAPKKATRRRKTKVGAKKAAPKRRKTARKKATAKTGVKRKRKVTRRKPAAKRKTVKKKPSKSKSKTKSKTTSKSTRVKVNRKPGAIKKAASKSPDSPKVIRASSKKKQRQATQSDSQARPVEQQPAIETKMAEVKKTKKRIEEQTLLPETRLESVTETDLNIAPYKEGPGEDYMSADQRAHFRRLLLQRKHELLAEMGRTVHHLQDEGTPLSDISDRATQEEEFSLELRARDRGRKLIKKIEEALQQIEEKQYGFCDSCGVEIGIRRLEARPTATLCIDCKTLDEIREKQMGG